MITPDELETDSSKFHGPMYAFARYVVFWKKEDWTSIVVHGDIYRYTSKHGKEYRYRYLGDNKERAMKEAMQEGYTDFFIIWTHCFAQISDAGSETTEDE